jgi:hypothetical protein
MMKKSEDACERLRFFVAAVNLCTSTNALVLDIHF